MTKELMLMDVDLNMFDANTNVTTDSGLSGEMKKYYVDWLIDMAQPELVHEQFAQMVPLPKGKGKTVEFRKYNPLPKALTPLTEGVTPDGRKLSMTTFECTVAQYGDYATLSDTLLLTAIDNNLVEATTLLGQQAGLTRDTIIREVMNGGTNVVYANGKTSRAALVGGGNSGNDYLTVIDLKKAVRALKVQNAPKIGDSYVGIIHPDVAFDLTNDSDWKYPHQYVDTENLYSGEIGKIAGVRFVEPSEAKVFKGENLTADARNLTVASYSSKVITVDEAITADEATALKGRFIIIHDSTHDELCEIASATAGAAGAATITLKDSPSNTPADGDSIYPGEGGAAGRAVYSTIILGKNAYGVTDLEGGGLQHIVKQLGAGDDPLNQRATAGWKMTMTAKRLIEQYMVRIESASTFDGVD